jgi:hypothetical protein
METKTFNRERVIEVLKKHIKTNCDTIVRLKQFESIASDLEGISEISQSCQKEVNSAENVISEVKELNCNNTCKWFKVGYGHCNLCSRNTARLYEHGKDNYEPISGVTESEPKDGVKESQNTELSEGRKVNLKCFNCESEDIFTVTLNHHKCRKCGKRFLTDMAGNKGSYAQLDEVKESGSVTDEEIINFALDYVSHKDLKPANRGLIKDALIIGAKWLRSRLQPAVAYNIGLQSYDNLADLINCIKSYDKTAPLEEKGRYFEAIQREFEKIQPAVTDEQIEKWVHSKPGNSGNPLLDAAITIGAIEGAKSMRDGKIPCQK